MADTGGDVLIETILDWGVEVVFGIPGDGINGIMEALRKRQDKIRFIQVRHEEAGRVHGLRLRQVHRQARRLPGHLRARAASICSTASTTPRWTASRCSPSPACTFTT